MSLYTFLKLLKLFEVKKIMKYIKDIERLTEEAADEYDSV